MPAQPNIKTPRQSSCIKAYLVPAPTNCTNSDNSTGTVKDMVVRQIPNQADPSKTLTIVQAAQYVLGPSVAASVGAVVDDGNGTTRIVPTLQPKVKIVQRLHHRQFVQPMPH
jgi:hypothetical protein